MKDGRSVRFIAPEKLHESFMNLGSPMAVTHGVYEISTSCPAEDLDWNHMDLDHRPWIHHTYLKASRVVVGPDIHSSVTKLSLFGIPLLVQVTDVRLEPTLFYQCFTFFSLIHAHLVMRSLPGKMHAEWYIVSNRIFKFLHGLLVRRLEKLEHVQNEEDQPLRKRRGELRTKGYRFLRDPLNYITANLKTDGVAYPKLGKIRAIALQGLKTGQLNLVTLGEIELLVRPEPDSKNAYSVWHGVCPHEGASLVEGKVCNNGNDIQCPWHGLRFGSVKLDSVRTRALLGPFELVLKPDSNEILVSDAK